MLSWQDLYTQTQKIVSDSTADTLVTIKIFLNEAKNIIMEDLGLSVTERTTTITSVASQKEYNLPIKFHRIKSATFTSGGYQQPIDIVESQEYWDELQYINTGTSDTVTHCFIRNPIGINEATIELFPTPASSSLSLIVVYESKEVDMSADDYTTGTVTVTNGDETVTGSGTTFTSAMVGRYLATTNDKNWYRIESYTSATSIELNKKFEGTTAATQTYRIIDAMPVPERLHTLPMFYAASFIYGVKGGTQEQVKYMAMFDNAFAKAKESMNLGKSASQVFKSRGYQRPVTNPNFSPRTIS